VPFYVILENGGGKIEYCGTLIMGKELASENNDRGRMLRQYLLMVEEQYHLGLRGGGDFSRIERMFDRSQRHTEGMFQRHGASHWRLPAGPSTL
jgi:hypothetical protein